MKKILSLVLLCLIFAITSCGKISSPEPIPGSGYPRTYPYR